MENLKTQLLAAIIKAAFTTLIFSFWVVLTIYMAVLMAQNNNFYIIVFAIIPAFCAAWAFNDSYTRIDFCKTLAGQMAEQQNDQSTQGRGVHLQIEREHPHFFTGGVWVKGLPKKRAPFDHYLIAYPDGTGDYIFSQAICNPDGKFYNDLGEPLNEKTYHEIWYTTPPAAICFKDWRHFKDLN